MLFLVSHETPYYCFKDLLTCICFAALGTIAALGLVIVTGNDPMARILGLAMCTFLSTFFFRASTVPIGALAFGCLSFMVISLWELQIPAEPVLHLSLWPVATLSTVAICAVAVDYLFNRGDPHLALQRETKARFEALTQLFLLFETRADSERLQDQISKVRRYAVTSQGRLQTLLQQIAARQADDALRPRDLSAVTLMLPRLLDFGAALAFSHDCEDVEPARLGRIRKALTAAAEGHQERIRPILGDSPMRIIGELDRFEQTLRSVGETSEPNRTEPATGASHRAVKSWHSYLAPDAFSNPTYVFYALKLSLCATICYVIFNGLKWPGISTAYFTVLFTGLSTTGATNRKLMFRIIGSTIGGLILGIGCLAFVFPNIESVTSFLLVIAAVSFIGAWVAGSSYFGYIGLQIVFAFNLLAFEGFSAPTQMMPARDRLLGILLGLIVMLVIFHQVRPERTIDTMRQTLARLLRAEGELVHLMDQELSSSVPSVKVIELRVQTERMVAALRGFSEVVRYEFEPDRTADIQVSEYIMNAVSSSANLLLSLRMWPEQIDTHPVAARLKEFRTTIEDGLRSLAFLLEQVSECQERSRESSQNFLDGLDITDPKSVGKTIDSFRELQMLCESIVSAGSQDS